MNAPNPYESPSTKSESSSWRPIDFVAVGVWLAIPIGVFIGRRHLLPMFEDFGVELPTATRYLLSLYSPLPFAIISIVVLVTALNLPYGSMRRRFIWLACITGGLIGATCLVLFLVPLFPLGKDLR